MFMFLFVTAIAALVISLLLFGYWLGFPEGAKFQHARAVGLQPYEIPPGQAPRQGYEQYSRPSLAEQMSLQRVIGGIFVLGGLWHSAAPWIFQYADESQAVTSNLISGLTLAAVGAAFVALRGGYWLTWLTGALGVWIIFEPHVVGFAHRGFAVNEAIWGGPITVLLSVIAAMDRWLAHAPARAPLAGEF